MQEEFDGDDSILSEGWNHLFFGFYVFFVCVCVWVDRAKLNVCVQQGHVLSQAASICCMYRCVFKHAEARKKKSDACVCVVYVYVCSPCTTVKCVCIRVCTLLCTGLSA